MKRRTLPLLALAACAASLSPTLHAQQSAPIRLVVPYAPGGPLDVTARADFTRLAGLPEEEFFADSFTSEADKAREAAAAA